MSPVGEIAARLFSQGDLPDRIRLTRDWHPVCAGSTWTWDDAARGYVADDGADRIFLAAFVRTHPGFFAAVMDQEGCPCP